jgi:hypothetical protein
MTIQQAMTRYAPERNCSELVHFTGGERFACGGKGDWRTANPGLVTCGPCRQTRSYRQEVARRRIPVEICEDKADAYGERLRYWADELRTGCLRDAGPADRYGIQPRKVRTATGEAWGLFVALFDESGIEYVPGPGEP